MDINTLEEENKQLKDEIKRLKEILDEYHITYEKPRYIPKKKKYRREGAIILHSFFKGRKDVYAKRVEGKNGTNYYPQCAHFYKPYCPRYLKEKTPCSKCRYQDYIPVNEDVYLDHLNGKAVYGIYPLCEDNTTYLLVFDFDDHTHKDHDMANTDNGWKEEVNALRKICEKENVPCLVERSRSGHGANVWLIFEKAIDASLARKFESELLTIGANYIDMKTFKLMIVCYQCRIV